MRIAVVDDERLIRKDLVGFIQELRPEAEICEGSSGEDAVKLASQYSFDIFFLDINLGDMKGTVLALMLDNLQPGCAVIFVTAYEEYGVKAFELDAVDYVMKPLGKQRIEKALLKAENALHNQRRAAFADHSSGNGGDTDSAEAECNDQELIVRYGKSIAILKKEDIVFIESKQRLCRIFCRDGKNYTSSQPLGEFVRKLESDHFMRIHKSFLVNLHYLQKIEPLYSKNYCIRMRGYEKEALPVGRNQIRQLKERYNF